MADLIMPMDDCEDGETFTMDSETGVIDGLGDAAAAIRIKPQLPRRIARDKALIDKDRRRWRLSAFSTLYLRKCTVRLRQVEMRHSRCSSHTKSHQNTKENLLQTSDAHAGTDHGPTNITSGLKRYWLHISSLSIPSSP
jgi:hypothetical protein